jgi:hypothetical protein
MTQIHKRIKFSYRTPKEHFSASVAIPRWIRIPFILIIGLILWFGVLSDSSGSDMRPAMDSILYVGVVVCIAILLAYADRKRSGSGKRRGKEAARRTITK